MQCRKVSGLLLHGEFLCTRSSSGPSAEKAQVDFETIDLELIQPALKKCRLTGTTTEQIPAQGNIRSDMLERLVGSDLVIVDISLSNPNVFYELGIRHGMRSRGTLLIRDRRSAASGDRVPFNLQTERYLEYDSWQPELSVGSLARRAIRAIARE